MIYSHADQFIVNTDDMKGVVMDGIYDPKLELEFKKIKNASQRNKVNN